MLQVQRQLTRQYWMTHAKASPLPSSERLHPQLVLLCRSQKDDLAKLLPLSTNILFPSSQLPGSETLYNSL